MITINFAKEILMDVLKMYLNQGRWFVCYEEKY